MRPVRLRIDGHLHAVLFVVGDHGGEEGSPSIARVQPPQLVHTGSHGFVAGVIIHAWRLTTAAVHVRQRHMQNHLDVLRGYAIPVAIQTHTYLALGIMLLSANFNAGQQSIGHRE